MAEHEAKTAGDASKDFFVASSKHPLSHKLMQAYGPIEEIEEGFQMHCQPADSESGGVYQEYLPEKQRQFTIAEEGDRRTAEARWREWYVLWTRFWFSMVGCWSDRSDVAYGSSSGSGHCFDNNLVLGISFCAYPGFATKAPLKVAVGAVAAYAAVLVVFVGSSLAPSVV